MHQLTQFCHHEFQLYMYTFTASYSFLLKQLICEATFVVHEQLVQLDLRSNFAVFTWLDISRGDAGVGVQCVMSQ